MGRTKVVGTLGPASREPAVLAALVGAGLDVARLNFSHGTPAEHARTLADLREAAARAGRPVAVLQDLAGPKIRTGPLAAGEVELAPGQAFTLTARPVPGDAREVGLTWPGLPRDVRPGDRLLLADGALELEAVAADDVDIACRVVTGGRLGAHKGINVPGRALTAPSLTAKDRADLAFGLAQGVDAVALSFVRGPADVAAAREEMRATGRGALLIAKIERPEAVAAIDGILAAADGIMVARGDLGVEIPVERVPAVQKSLIAAANRAGKPVITATQMLRSMVASPRPTRAEVTDVANAILDGTDAVMLSEETASGDWPVESVAMMRRIAAEAEAVFPHATWAHRFAGDGRESDAAAVAHAACEIAGRVGATVILTLTRSGATAGLVARYRPPQPVLALTPDPRTCRRLALVWGVVPELTEEADDAAALERAALGRALALGLLRPGERAVLTGGSPPAGGGTNLIRILAAPPAGA